MRKLFLVLICITLTYLFIESLIRIWDVNDYDVIRHGPNLIWKGDLNFYRVGSIENRHYLYPPISLIPLFPLGLLPYHAGGVIFSIARIFLILYLLYIVSKWCGESVEISVERLLLLATLSLLVCFRFVQNEFRNGQINILLTTFCIAGVYFSLSKSWLKQLSGGALIAVAASIKVTPIFFIAPLLLHKRWKTILFVFVTLFILQIILWGWLGFENTQQLWATWRSIAEDMARDGATGKRVISLSEF